MQPIKTTCPECNHPFDYWTKTETINCPKCGVVIPAEPCKEELDYEPEGE